MSATAENDTAISTTAAGDFQALEDRILRTVSLLRSERELRTASQNQATALGLRVEEQRTRISKLEEEIVSLERERDTVRQRIERLLKQLDEASV